MQKKGHRTMSVNRREWMKLSAGAGAGLAVSTLGLDPEEAQAATPKESKLAGTIEVKTACNFCSCGCGMVCSVRDGKVVNLEGDPDHVINEGALCSKGAAMSAVPNSPRRLTTPLYRAPGATAWQELSWDDAYARIAKKMKQVRDEHWIATEDGFPVNRTDAIGFLGGAQNTNEECYLVTKLARLAGTVAVEHQARL
jgi:formate dehydrogenase major subunit